MPGCECENNTLNLPQQKKGADNVDIQLMKMKNHCLLIVEDNGKGIIKDESSDGLGMLNINNRLRTINGNLNMDSEKDEGTMASIRIAVA